MNLQFSPTSTTSCFVNLRHSQKGLESVGPLTGIEIEPQSRLLLSVGDIDIVSSGNNLMAVNHTLETVITFDTVESQPRCAIELSPGQFTIFFSDRRESYTINSDNSITRDTRRDLSPVAVVASDLGSVSTRIAGVSLSRKYSGSTSSLDPVDVSKISSSFLSAISDATTSAWKISRFVNPVVARCRIVDSAGNTIFTGPPVLINPLSDIDIQPLTSVTVSSEFDSFPTTTVDIDSFTLQLQTVATNATPGLSVIVEVINQVSFIDFEGVARCSVNRNSSGNTSVTVTSPLITGNGSLSHAVTAMLSFPDTMFVPFARVDNPFDGTAKTISLVPDKPFVSSSSPASISRQFKKQLKLTQFESVRLSETIGLPHLFLPSVASKNGSSVLYANPEVIYFEGYNPLYFLADKSGSNGSYRASSIVNFYDDSSVCVSSIESTGNVPLKLSPVISYPSRKAKSITIEIVVEGVQVYRHTFALTPLSGRDMAVFINESLRPVNMSGYTELAADLPVNNPPRLTMPGVVLSAAADNPFMPVDATFDSTARVKSIMPVVCSPRGLEQRRNRFYLIGPDGIKLLTLNDNRQIVNIVLTDRRGAESTQSVAVDSMGRVIVLSSSGHLIALSGASAATLDRVDGRGIVADNTHNELWIIGTESDRFVVRDMEAGDYYWRTLDSEIDTWANSTAGSSIIAGDKIMRLGNEKSTTPVKISASMKIAGSRSTKTGIGSRMRTPAIFVFKLGAARAKSGIVEVSTDDTSGNSRTGSTRGRSFEGVVNREIILPVNFHPAETYTAKIETVVAPRSVFGGVKIMYRR